MRRSRVLLLSAATLTLLNISVVARAQYSSKQGYSLPPAKPLPLAPSGVPLEAPPGAPLSERFPGMPGAALRSGQPSVGFAVQYVEARPAVRVPVTENRGGHGGSDEKILRGGSAGMLSRRMHAAF